jgi:Pvc16 N-terminal domain
MANIGAIRSVGNSLAEFLDHSYQAAIFPPDVNKPNCTFSVVSSGAIQEAADPENAATTVQIFLYHVSTDPHLRNSGRLIARDMVSPPLSLELHYLFTFWSNSAENEHLVLAWTMLQLQATSLLDATVLSSEAGWTAEDVIQLVPEELSNPEIMRIWDTLEPKYRLSVAYVARVVRIEPDEIPEQRAVVATRFNYAVPAEAP